LTDHREHIPKIAPRVIAIVGFMGAGKTTIGRALASRLKCRFVDLDEQIVRAERMTVPVIFRDKGEGYFRQAETRELQRILTTCDQLVVLSLGGGAFVSETNRTLLRDFGAMAVQLTAPVEELRRRVGNAHERPLARDPEKFRKLYEQRQPAYALADLTVNTSGKSVEEAATMLFNQVIAKAAEPECSPKSSAEGETL
jgi:shikimate kinase